MRVSKQETEEKNRSTLVVNLFIVIIIFLHVSHTHSQINYIPSSLLIGKS